MRMNDILSRAGQWYPLHAVATACVDIKKPKRLSPVGKPKCSGEGCERVFV